MPRNIVSNAHSFQISIFLLHNVWFLRVFAHLDFLRLVSSFHASFTERLWAAQQSISAKSTDGQYAARVLTDNQSINEYNWNRYLNYEQSWVNLCFLAPVKYLPNMKDNNIRSDHLPRNALWLSMRAAIWSIPRARPDPRTEQQRN